MNKEQICQKILAILPSLGSCGVDLTVVYDEENARWCISLRQEGKALKTFLEPGMLNCVSTGRNA